MAEILDIVNANDEVIGQIDRNDPSKEQHIVRVVFVGFYTSDKRVILQRRGIIKQNAGKLTATVSGHVESGSTYDETAIKESLEEAGIRIELSRAANLGVMLDSDINVMRAIYAYPFDGDLDDLKIEGGGQGGGFIAIPIDDLQHERVANPDRFTGFLRSPAGKRLLDHIEAA